jgi:hypothetical protein
MEGQRARGVAVLAATPHVAKAHRSARLPP